MIEIPEWLKKPTSETFLSVDMHGKKIKVGDKLQSTLRGIRDSHEKREIYEPVELYEGHLVIPLSGSWLLDSFVKSYCEIT